MKSDINFHLHPKKFLFMTDFFYLLNNILRKISREIWTYYHVKKACKIFCWTKLAIQPESFSFATDSARLFMNTTFEIIFYSLYLAISESYCLSIDNRYRFFFLPLKYCLSKIV